MQFRFDLFRISVIPKSIDDLFAKRVNSREAYLREIFATRFDFQHRGDTFYYVPGENSNETDIVFGRVGRQMTSEGNLHPTSGFEEAEYEMWRASSLFIDPNHHEDGQKLAFEYDKDVGQPEAIIGSMVDQINEIHQSYSFHIEIAAIFEATDFWTFVNENRGSVTSVTFDFIVPNMFGGSDEIQNELRQFRDIEKAQLVTMKMTSSEGLNTDSPRIEASVKHVERGGGKISARAKGKKIFASSDNNKCVKCTAENKKSLINMILMGLVEVFGR